MSVSLTLIRLSIGPTCPSKFFVALAWVCGIIVDMERPILLPALTSLMFSVLTSFLLLFFVAPRPQLTLAAEPQKKTEPAKPGTTTFTVLQLLTIKNSPAYASLKEQKLPRDGAFKLSKLFEVIDKEASRAESLRIALYTDEVSVKLPNGGRQLKLEKQEEFQKSFDALAAEKVELPISPIIIEDDYPNIQLSVRDVQDLGPLIKEKK